MTDQNFDENKSPEITAWKLARSAIEHENSLIHHRLTWFFQGQAFLLAGFFVALGAPKESFLREDGKVALMIFSAIGFLAVYLCAVISNGLQRAYLAIDRVTGHFVRLAEINHWSWTPPIHLWTKPTLAHTIYIPNVTLVVWLILETVLFYRLRSEFSGMKISTLSTEGYIALASLFASGFAAIIAAYLVISTRKANRKDGRRFWDEDPQGERILRATSDR